MSELLPKLDEVNARNARKLRPVLRDFYVFQKFTT